MWFRRDDDGGGGNSKRPGKTVKRAATRPRWGTRTNAMADAGAGDGPFYHTSLPLAEGSRLSPQPLIQPRLRPQQFMPRPRVGAPAPVRAGAVRAGAVGFRGPMALSSVEPEPECNGVEDFFVLALVFMLALVGLKKLRRLQKPRGMREPLMDA